MPMGRPKAELTLSAEEQQQLQSLARSRSLPAALTLRAKLVLACAEGAANSTVAERHGVTPATVGKWRRRFLERRITGLHDELRPGQPRTVDDERLATLINTTLHAQPRDGATHWTIRGVAAETGISKTSVHRYLQLFGVAPHRSESFKLSTDPFFIEKLRDVVGLYLNPPDKALVLCVDEKSQVQALERTQPLLPLGFGYVEGVTHDYKRHGTTTLFAALDVLTGQVLAQCKPRHRHQEFLGFLRAIEAAVPTDLDVHLIVDNYSTHKHPEGQGLAGCPSALASALRADVQFVAESGRALLCAHHRARHPPRFVPLGARTDSAYRSFRRQPQYRLQTLRLDRHRRFNPRQAAKTYHANQRDSTLVPLTHKFAYMPRTESARRPREANRSHSLGYGEDERQSDRRCGSVRT